MGSKSRQSFVTGAAILGAAALTSKLLGAIYRIPYQNITGDVGLAAYNKVYPLYSMLLIMATAGFPLAISKIVAERLALGDKIGARRVLNISVYVLSVTGFIFFALLFFGASSIARWMGNPELTIVIKSVSFALLIVPTMAAIRGYYQGHQYMIPTANSQIVEQIVRVITILILSYWFINNGYSVYYAAAGATFGAVTGAIFAFLVLLLYWKKTNQITDEMILESGKIHIGKQEDTTQVIKKILYYSIPIALGSIILPFFQIVDSFSVSNVIALSVTKSKFLFGTYLKGQMLANFTEYWFGIYSRGQALIQFAAFFATSLSIALVPAVSGAKAKNDMDLVAKGTELALRLTLMIGLPASIGLAVLAEPVNIMLYKDNVGTDTMAILAFTTIFSTLFMTSSGILQGIGKVMLPAKNLLIAVIFKLVLNITLVYYISINGAAIATVTAYGLAATLNIVSIMRYIDIKISFSNFILKPVIATLMMGLFVFISKILIQVGLEPIILSERLLMAIIALTSVGIGVLSFVVSLFISGAITRQDLNRIPKYGQKMIKLADKVKILKG
ncbi:hypothetical protein BHF71_05180 [Vulcanibacillus modesticaldus]|uniref:Uncharacterized protein n=1 Tax=Vulcanibacillus modesticaldus TaxID=337097 RepID=A0A1D2YXB6_9BACI|nr:polysaccharide biosynthesis protein [Vulcanibacillus modesticaldus]OEG00298.1 hypothetical protein BHF71_05180 [Vulcanibacillus modesticaldus]